MEAGMRFPLCKSNANDSILPVLGPHVMVHSAIEKAGTEHRKEMLNNIVMVGGHTCYQGMDMRLTYELKQLSAATARIKVIAPARADRPIASWMGGSILVCSFL